MRNVHIHLPTARRAPTRDAESDVLRKLKNEYMRILDQIERRRSQGIEPRDLIIQSSEIGKKIDLIQGTTHERDSAEPGSKRGELERELDKLDKETEQLYKKIDRGEDQGVSVSSLRIRLDKVVARKVEIRKLLESKSLDAAAIGPDGKHVGEWGGDVGSIYTKDAVAKPTVQQAEARAGDFARTTGMDGLRVWLSRQGFEGGDPQYDAAIRAYHAARKGLGLDSSRTKDAFNPQYMAGMKRMIDEWVKRQRSEADVKRMIERMDTGPDILAQLMEYFRSSSSKMVGDASDVPTMAQVKAAIEKVDLATMKRYRSRLEQVKRAPGSNVEAGSAGDMVDMLTEAIQSA